MWILAAMVEYQYTQYGVYNMCSLSRTLEETTMNLPAPRPLPGRENLSPFVVVADDAFAMKPYLLKPYPFKNQPGPNRVLNYRLSRARRIIENVFGIIANRFRILRKPIQFVPEKVRKIVLAICVLHNFLMIRNSSKANYPPVVMFDIEKDGSIINGQWREEGFPKQNLLPLHNRNSHNCSQNAKTIREDFKDYFISPEGEGNGNIDIFKSTEYYTLI